ncbi:hypothetical protein FGIG_10833 [Fasciola gigantica]|uniref:Uncharacterized protein n=1 Tax=Fasciola gigantica TaxID=46835 RepID=A0A504YSM5_FASGI|nr:hypothetical protein FGIG_10833 [Fasciola gigantica]
MSSSALRTDRLLTLPGLTHPHRPRRFLQESFTLSELGSLNQPRS